MIYIIRHGQTEMNLAQTLQGRSDHPLNPAGIAQAKEAAAWFAERQIRFDRVLSSPLQRAIETARLVAGNSAGIEIDERLIEMDYGPYEGMDLTRPAPEVMEFFRDFVHNPAPLGMEPLDAVVARLGALLEELRTARREENILLSTHAIAMKGALEYLTPSSHGRYWSKHIGNCAVYRAELSDGQFSVPTEVRPT